MARYLRLTVAALLALMVAAPAGAVPHPEATYRTQRVYLHCVDDTVREDNVTAGTVTWDTSPPDGAFAGDGDGCAATQVMEQDPPVVGHVGAFSIAGTFTGNLQAMTLQLHDLGHGAVRDPAGARVAIEVRLSVDGEEVVADTASVPAASENSGVTDRFVFSIDGFDLAPEEGDGTIERTYELTFATDPGIVFVYDAQEVPAGITFNPNVLAGTVITAG